MNPPTSLSAAVERLALPAFIFSAIFLTGVLTLTVLFDPGRYPVRVGNSVVRLRDLATEHAALLTREAELAKEEQSLDELTPTPTLTMLRQLRAERAPSYEAIVAVERARRTFSLASGNPITLAKAALSDDKTLTITGDVADQAGRTMQLLAAFVDRLRDQKVFVTVSEPEYRDELDGSGMPRSPFVITLTLRHE